MQSDGLTAEVERVSVDFIKLVFTDEVSADFIQSVLTSWSVLTSSISVNLCVTPTLRRGVTFVRHLVEKTTTRVNLLKKRKLLATTPVGVLIIPLLEFKQSRPSLHVGQLKPERRQRLCLTPR